MNKIMLLSLLIFTSIHLTACMGCYNPNGCGHDTSPYFYTTTTTQIRGLGVPAKSKLTYNARNYAQKEEQMQLLNEKDLIYIDLPPNTAIIWGGMPSSSFMQFFNSEMKGFTVYRAENFIPESSTEFIKLWQSCNRALDITLTNPNDWSFNPENMEIRGCGVNIQKRSEYNEHWPNQDQADAFLIRINQALHKLPKQQSYPVVHTPIEK